MNLTTIKQTGVALAVAQALAVNVSSAATIEVNNAGDLGLNCTFREAVSTINIGSPQANGCFVNTNVNPLGTDDTIEFSGFINTISLTAGEILIRSDISINPGGSELSIVGNNNSRLLNISGATALIENTTLTGGSTGSFGGGIFATSGSTVGLANSTVSDNSAGFSGGIFLSSSQLILTGSTISGNSVSGSGGGIQALASSTVFLINSSLSGNTADLDGGGIFAGSNSEVFLFRSTISGNSSFENGGGVFATSNSGVFINQSTVSQNNSYAGGGIDINDSSTATIDDSTVSGNSADDFGGGLRISDGATLTINNSTVSGNRGRAGGINIVDSEISLTNSTVFGNSAFYGAGIEASGSSTVTLVNSIVAGNYAPYGYGTDLAVFPGSSLTATGNNLLGDSSKTSDRAFYGVGPSAANIIATSDGNTPTPIANIARPLANNGGRTQTHALVAGSPAIDAGNNAACAAPPINNFDQRLRRRPIGTSCDIGSFEFEPETTFFVIPLPNGKSVVFGL